MLRARGCAVPSREALREKLWDVSGSFRVVDSLRIGLAAESNGVVFDVTLGPPAPTHAFRDARDGTVYVSPPDNPAARGSLATPLLARAVSSALGVGDDGTATAALVALVQASSAGEDPIAAMEATTIAFGGNVRDDEDSSSRDSDVPFDTAHGDGASASARGDPGAVVLPRDARLLAARPLRPLVAGETCAIRESKIRRRFGSPGEAAAAAAESRAAGSGGVAHEDRYVYARVVSATRPAKGAALTRVLLESGPGGETLEALSSEVFTFRLVSELGPDETGAGAGGGSGRDGPEPTFTASRDPLEAVAVTPADPSGEFTSPTRRADCADSGFDSSRDPVSSDDLVRAVRDLLTAAGAPPSAAQTDLLAANQRLRGELEDVSGEVAAAEKEIAEKEAHAARVEKAFLCPITQGVMTDPVVALDGHTYERRAIEQWFSQGRLTSPVTNLRLNTTTLVPNHALRGAITAHASRSGE